ncbi:MAG: OmpA family protein [Bacteroidia bacterium]|nr:OmpA family protein [Bacteroidia bacterium]MDW8159047.1 OmpA family protein [Bacteroidia bacterium]
MVCLSWLGSILPIGRTYAQNLENYRKVQLLILRADSLLTQKDTLNAIFTYQKALSTENDLAQEWAEKTGLASKLKNYKIYLNQKVFELEKQANQFYEQRALDTAAKLWQKAIQIKPFKVENYFSLARCFTYMGLPDSALALYPKIEVLSPGGSNNHLYFHWANALKTVGQYAKADSLFKVYLKQCQNDSTLPKPNYCQQAEQELLGQDSLQLKNIPPCWEITNTILSTPQADYHTALWQKGKQRYIMYTSHRVSEKNNNFPNYPFLGQKYSDCYAALLLNKYENNLKEEDSAYFTLTNTIANDGNPVIDPLNGDLYYTICGEGLLRKKEGCKIYKSTYDYENKQWSAPTPIKELAGWYYEKGIRKRKYRKPAFDSQPSFSKNGKYLFFVSNREGSIGGTDIWVCERLGNVWSKPRNLGKNVNTPQNELYPNASSHPNLLFFASNGHKGLGGYDLFRVELEETEPIAKPQNLGFPFNTSWDDIHILWLVHDTVAMLSSNRRFNYGNIGKEKGKGSEDIWMIRNTCALQEKKIAEERRLQELQKIAEEKAKKEAEAKALQQKLAQETEQKKYFEEQKIKTLTLEDSLKLLGYSLDQTFEIKNILYAFDKADLLPQSIIALNEIIEILNRFPKLHLEISSHTDARGTEAYNFALSQRRAQSVVNYLVSKGIAPQRLKYQGYGETRLKFNPARNEEEHQQNRRTEFRLFLPEKSN